MLVNVFLYALRLYTCFSFYIFAVTNKCGHIHMCEIVMNVVTGCCMHVAIQIIIMVIALRILMLYISC